MPEEAPEVKEVVSVETARTMMQLLQAVIKSGTGASAAPLKHPLGGKTGTTNNFTDAWFIGFSPSVTCGTWIGFDNRETLGEKETGAHAALPMWIEFMKAAIANKPNETFATGGEPKKVLEVKPGDVANPVKREQTKPREDVDPDAAVGDEITPASGGAGGASAPAAPVRTPLSAPATPAESPRSGVAQPPADKD